MSLIVTEVYDALVAAGAPDEKARAAAGVIPMTENLATRQDLAEFKAASQQDFAEFRAEIRQDFTEFRTEMKREFAEFKAEMKRGVHRIQDGDEGRRRQGLEGRRQRPEARYGGSEAGFRPCRSCLAREAGLLPLTLFS